MSKPKDKKAVKLAAVLYTDGSAQPNPGYGGYGIHGYTYDLNHEYKISKTQTKNITTNYGYKHIKDIDNEEVIPFKKVDVISMYGSGEVGKIVNNNQMELLALEKAFDYIKKKEFNEVTILSDSQTSLYAVGHYYDNWSRNGWLNSSGKPVKLRAEIERAYQKKQDALAICPTIRLKYVKGHSGDFGNDNADKLAKMGANLHRHGKQLDVDEMDNQMKDIKVSYNEFFTRSRWYFMGGKKHALKDNKLSDWFVYYVGHLGYQKKDKDLGMRAADGVSSLILLKEKEPLLDKIESIYREKNNHEYDFVVCGRLDVALSPAAYRDIMGGNLDLILEDPAQKTLSLPNGKVICIEYNPAHLSYYHMTHYSQLEQFAKYATGLDTFERYQTTDITSLLVDVKEGGKKPTYALKGTIGLTNSMKFDVKYWGEDGIKSRQVILTEKIDMPDKVHLAKLIRLFGDKIKIEIITYRATGDLITYCCKVSTDDAIGLWMNFCSSCAFV